jgi:hypothetical protein
MIESFLREVESRDGAPEDEEGGESTEEEGEKSNISVEVNDL